MAQTSTTHSELRQVQTLQAFPKTDEEREAFWKNFKELSLSAKVEKSKNDKLFSRTRDLQSKLNNNLRDTRHKVNKKLDRNTKRIRGCTHNLRKIRGYTQRIEDMEGANPDKISNSLKEYSRQKKIIQNKLIFLSQKEQQLNQHLDTLKKRESEDHSKYKKEYRQIEVQLIAIANAKEKLLKEKTDISQQIEFEKKKLQERRELLLKNEQSLEEERIQIKSEREVLEKLLEQKQREEVTESTLKIIQAIKNKKNVTKIKKLLDAGANIKVQDEQGLTPLHHAAKMGRVDVIQLLFTHPSYAPPFALLQEKSGKTAADIAAECKDKVVFGMKFTQNFSKIISLLRMKEQTENADAIQKEFELVGELYEEEKKYRQLYSQCVTDVESTLSPVEKKNITEVYQRYQDFYHPVLFPTQLYANTEFIFEAYRQDGREAIRLRNEENTFATKSQNIATQRIPKYEQDHIFPLRTFQNVLAGKIPFTRDQVARLLQKFSNREIFEMFGTKEGVTVDFVAKQLHPDLKKKKRIYHQKDSSLYRKACYRNEQHQKYGRVL